MQVAVKTKLMELPKWIIIYQKKYGIKFICAWNLEVINENRSKDSSIYPGVLPWPWAVGFNFGNFINSQLI